jgi:predicted CopG family antitoxin
MRKTLTIDDDVVAALERLRRTRGVSLTELVNEVLRRGLKDIATKPKRREPFRTRSVHVGEPRIKNFDNISEVLAMIEGEAYK